MVAVGASAARATKKAMVATIDGLPVPAIDPSIAAPGRACRRGFRFGLCRNRNISKMTLAVCAPWPATIFSAALGGKDAPLPAMLARLRAFHETVLEMERVRLPRAAA